MSNIKLSQLPALTPSSTSQIVGVNSGTTDGLFTVGQILALPASNLPFISVKAYGATGNGTTDDTAAIQAAINAVFHKATAINTTNAIQNLGILIFPPGNYIITSALTLDGLLGGIILGSGRMTTTIHNTGTGGCFNGNGIAYSHFSGIQLQCDDNSNLFNLDWDGSSFISTQSNTFLDIFFQGAGAFDGVAIGASGFQASENTFLNCFFANCNNAGIEVLNGNALQQTVIGGNFQDCLNGVLVQSGSVPVISGVGFQGSQWDIQILGSSSDTYAISGCRTESAQFINALRGNCVVTGCEQFTSAGSPIFAQIQFHNMALISCTARGGGILKNNGGTNVAYTVTNCEFSAANWSDGNSFGNVENTWYNYTGESPEAGGGTMINDSFWFGTGSAIVNYPVHASSAALTDAASIATDASKGVVFTVTIAGNRTLANPTNLLFNDTFKWVITQGAGGSHTLAYDTLFTFPGGVTPTLSTGAGNVDMLTCVYDGAALRCSLQNAFAT